MPILISSVIQTMLPIKTYSHLPYPYPMDLSPYSYDPYLDRLKA
jgi:hypothetical protein